MRVLEIFKADLKMLIDNAAVLRHGTHPTRFEKSHNF